jgi:hypothetical protein
VTPCPDRSRSPWFDRSRSPWFDSLAVAVARTLAGPDAARFVAARRLVPGGRFLVHLARQPEVHDAHLVVAPDHDVVGLEIAVHQPLLVRGRQAPPRRHEHLQDLLPAALRCLQPVGDGVPIDELHRDEHLLGKRTDVEHNDDVRVRQPGESPAPRAASVAVPRGATPRRRV